MFAGFVGGKVDSLLMRLVDILMAFPALLLAVCIVAITGPSLQNAILAIGLVSVPHYARVARGATMVEVKRICHRRQSDRAEPFCHSDPRHPPKHSQPTHRHRHIRFRKCCFGCCWTQLFRFRSPTTPTRMGSFDN